MRPVAVWIGLVLTAAPAFCRCQTAGTAGLEQALQRLPVTGRVLMIGAHPDDENTALLAYFARGRNLRTAYLSLTRGEGGQNLIGPEQGAALGVIRTQELMAARCVDGAGQFFSRAIDFGFTKTASETLKLWNHDQVLSDVVWVIRGFRPDVIVLRFSGTPRDGHGQHQSSAILGKEAFSAAADPARFPEQLKYVKPWQAKRMMYNLLAFTPEQRRQAQNTPGAIPVDVGEYNPILGYSYAELAGKSRSMHRSQAMGAAEPHGRRVEYLVTIAGDPAKAGVFDGIDSTWKRFPAGEAAGAAVAGLAAAYDPVHPEKLLPGLAQAYRAAAGLQGLDAEEKREELANAMLLAGGIWLSADAARGDAIRGDRVKIRLTALNRSHAEWKLLSAGITEPGKEAASAPAALEYNVPLQREAEWTVPPHQPYTEPYWLREPADQYMYTVPDLLQRGRPENPPVLTARFELETGGTRFRIDREVDYRYVDKLMGEQVRPLEVVPSLALHLPGGAVIFPDSKPRELSLRVTSTGRPVQGTVRMIAPPGWQVSPASVQLSGEPDANQAVQIQITPPVKASRADLRVEAQTGAGTVQSDVVVISHPHIPPQTLMPPAKATLVRSDIRVAARNIGYVMGAGDEVPEALRQIGCQVTLLTSDALAQSDLSQFDAIVTGVRAYNVRPDLRKVQPRLNEYMRNGGTLVVQYNVNYEGTQDLLAPYPLELGRGRTTVEDAPVEILSASSSVLHYPNEITPADFEGWVQERLLYAASSWDKEHYTPIFESHDPGEPPLPGGMLVAPVGKGAFVFSSYSWFRQLPAGVPGAYRIFANLLSAGKAH